VIADLSGRYELIEEAGRGGMGVVYKARDRETNETVALKILKPEIAVDPVASERFINEVRLSRRITHKNVCRIYEFSRAGATAYLSMEYVEGESLRAIVDRMGAVGLRKGVQIARQICSALHEAHAQGIIHRDLKPENVMLDKSGNVKVMDFGIARLMDASVTATAGGIIGTPAYMAPEQAEGKEVDGRTDIYATGLILYEIFTGKAAFTGDTPMVVALKQIRETPVAPRTLESSLPWELDAVIMRCLEKDPAARFQSVEQLDEALAAVSAGNTTTGSLGRISATGTAPAPTPNRATAATAAGSGAAAQTWPEVAKERTTPIGKRRKRKPMTRRRRPIALIAGLLALAYVFGVFKSKDPVPFKRFTLDNGLKVILSEDHSAPTIAVAVTYNVGGKDDPPDRSGLAHLFEHMMFNGSLNVGKGEHQYLVTSQGGVPNGQTFIDHTAFWETLPSNQLDLALFLEADRMRSLRLDQARLDVERGTVIAERQQRVENVAYGRVTEAILNAAYDIPNYKKLYLGREDSMRSVTLQEVNDFFRIFYAPNNAVLTLVGDFDSGEARKKITNYFEHIQAQPPAPVTNLRDSPQTSERRVSIQDPFATGPRVYVTYKTPAGAGKDAETLLVLNSLLGESNASRLQQKLVKELEVAAGVGTLVDARRGPGLFTVALLPAQGRDEQTVLNAFESVMDEIRRKGVSDEEVKRARTRIRLARATALQQSAQRALLLGEYEVKYGGAEGVNRRAEDLGEVDAENVKDFADRYLRPEQRTIVNVARGGTTTPAYAADTTVRAIANERLGRAPLATDLVHVSIPEAVETTLDNGLTLVAAHTNHAPIVSVRFEIRGAGSLYAPAANPAVASVAAAMLREGTATRASKGIAEDLDNFGASLTVGQGSDAASVSVQAIGLADTFNSWFPVVADVVSHASFPGDELPLLKRRLLTETQIRRSTPSALAGELLDEMLYGADAASPITPQQIEAVTADQLRAWYAERYAPQNVILSVAGAVKTGRIQAEVTNALARWTKTSFTEPTAQLVAPSAAKVVIVDRPGSVQTALALGVRGVDRAHPDQLPLVVANRVLGGGPASRLFIKLREERGLTYGVLSQLNAFKQGGDWRMAGDITSTRIAEGVEALTSELKRIGSDTVPDQELNDGKRSIVASFAVTLEQLPQLVSYMSSRRVYGLSSDYWDRFPQKVMAVSPADLKRVGATYMDMSRIQVVAVGDSATLRPVLEPFGRVTVVK
jgi:zinc protease